MHSPSFRLPAGSGETALEEAANAVGRSHVGDFNKRFKSVDGKAPDSIDGIAFRIKPSAKSKIRQEQQESPKNSC